MGTRGTHHGLLDSAAPHQVRWAKGLVQVSADAGVMRRRVASWAAASSALRPLALLFAAMSAWGLLLTAHGGSAEAAGAAAQEKVSGSTTRFVTAQQDTGQKSDEKESAERKSEASQDGAKSASAAGKAARADEEEDEEDLNRLRNLTFDDIKFDMEKGEKFERKMLTAPIEKLLKGQRIRIKGYMLPSFQQRGIKQFVLVRDNMECCFGPGAALYDCIIVEMVPGKTTEFTVRPITVEGVFRFKELVGPDGKHLAIYHLKADRVQ